MSLVLFDVSLIFCGRDFHSFFFVIEVFVVVVVLPHAFCFCPYFQLEIFLRV